MINLRRPNGFTQDDLMFQDPGGGQTQGAPPPGGGGMGNIPSPPLGGGDPGGAGNKLKPIELNPGKGPSGNTPHQPQEPQVGDMNEPHQSFMGGGSNTLSPPSVTQKQPFMSLNSPSPESLVGGKGSLFGSGGGQFGGGLGLGSGQAQGGAQNPSSLILSLLQLLGK